MKDDDSPIIKEITIEFLGGKEIEEKAVLDRMKTKVGARLGAASLDSDLKNLNDFDLIERANFLSEPVEGGVRLIISVVAVKE